jgi:quinol-cytochrome oxidoreductase complex cytochrome b subunit/coenzyme F420-reducing hydrogenase delta subunit
LTVRGAVAAVWQRTESSLDIAFPPGNNPLRQLGALGWMCYWIVLASGIYLFIFFDTGIEQAYSSLQRITEEQWYAGGIMRSLHRYASDALVVIVALHLLREILFDRLHGARAFTWVIGVLLIGFLYASGITGYWLVWDRLAQYIAVATTEWLDALPVFAEPVARNFLHPGTLSGRFFTLFCFIHIAVPLFMLFGMWLHIQRLSQPKVNPPRELALGFGLMLLGASLLRPAVSQAPADLTTVPAVVGFDWFYLQFYPLLDRMSGAAAWSLLGAIAALLLTLPWLTRRIVVQRAAAAVDLSNCNGCGRCVQDCPFSAVSLKPRSDGLPFTEEAVVDPDLCVGCGICVGACPTASPFRRGSALVAGIELPDFMTARLRDMVVQAFAEQHGAGRILVFRCAHANAPQALPGVATITLPCIGHLPPPFVDFTLSHRHADGVVIAGCADIACYERLGQQWTQQRLARTRDPKLRQRVPMDRVRPCWAGHDARVVDAEIRDLRKRIDTRVAEVQPCTAN